VSEAQAASAPMADALRRGFFLAAIRDAESYVPPAQRCETYAES